MKKLLFTKRIAIAQSEFGVILLRAQVEVFNDNTVAVRIMDGQLWTLIEDATDTLVRSLEGRAEEAAEECDELQSRLAYYQTRKQHEKY